MGAFVLYPYTDFISPASTIHCYRCQTESYEHCCHVVSHEHTIKRHLKESCVIMTYWHTSFLDAVSSGVSIAPTPQVRAPVMLLLLVAGN
jgi:hypothetical protein